MLLSMDTVLTLAALQVMKTFLFLFAVLFFWSQVKKRNIFIWRVTGGLS